MRGEAKVESHRINRKKSIARELEEDICRVLLCLVKLFLGSLHLLPPSKLQKKLWGEVQDPQIIWEAAALRQNLKYHLPAIQTLQQTSLVQSKDFAKVWIRGRYYLRCYRRSSNRPIKQQQDTIEINYTKLSHDETRLLCIPCDLRVLNLELYKLRSILCQKGQSKVKDQKNPVTNSHDQ